MKPTLIVFLASLLIVSGTANAVPANDVVREDDKKLYTPKCGANADRGTEDRDGDDEDEYVAEGQVWCDWLLD